jgi:hypothetical protein
VISSKKTYNIAMSEQSSDYRQRTVDILTGLTRAQADLMSGPGKPAGHLRMEAIIAIEEAHQFAKLMGVPMAEIVKAHVLGSPDETRLDYLATVADRSIIDHAQAIQIGRELDLFK